MASSDTAREARTFETTDVCVYSGFVDIREALSHFPYAEILGVVSQNRVFLLGASRTKGELLYGASGGPISGVRTGFAKPKKTTVPLPPKRVASAGSGTSLKPWSGLSQLFATHTLPAGSTATSVMVCNPPM